MKTTVAELTRRAEELSLDRQKKVLSWHGNLAKVRSASSDSVWDVSIMMGPKERERIVTCTCPAMKGLCWHAVAFFAVAKGINPTTHQDMSKPDEGKETPPEPIKDPHTDGMKMIAGAIEMLVDGIGLLVDERMKEE